MSMKLVRLPSDIADRVVQGGPGARDLLEKESEDSGQWFHLGNSWAAIHFTISGDQPLTKQEVLEAGLSFHEDGRGNILMGGSATGLESDIDTARYMAPDEVSRNWRLLSEITAERFRERYEPEALDTEDIPPHGWVADPDREDLLTDAFLELRVFFQEAAEDGHGIVLEFVASDD